MSGRRIAADQRVDSGLRELLGGERPPDLTGAVVRRLAQGDGARLLAALPQPARPRRWAAAALALLGLGTVVAALLLRTRGADDGALQDPDATPVEVHSRAEVEALPPDTRAVVGLDLWDDAIAALLRLRELRSLELRCPQMRVVGLEPKTVALFAPGSITAASLPLLAQLTKLRRLRLVGTYRVTDAFAIDGSGLEAAVDQYLGPLERLPLLEELALSYFDLPDHALAVLPRLRSLRRLDLQANHGFGSDGIACIAACRTLRAVDLACCQQLQGRDLARLGELPELEELDLGRIDGVNWRSSVAESQFRGPEAGRLWERIQRQGTGSGVTDEALAGIAKAPRLRVLGIAQARCTVDGLTVFADSPALRELDVAGASRLGDGCADALPPSLRRLEACGEFTDVFCARLRQRLPQLETLVLPACYRITDAGLAELVRIASLRHLDIRQSRGLTAASMASLRAATQLTSLDVRHIDWVRAADVAALRRSLPDLRELHASGQ